MKYYGCILNSVTARLFSSAERWVTALVVCRALGHRSGRVPSVGSPLWSCAERWVTTHILDISSVKLCFILIAFVLRIHKVRQLMHHHKRTVNTE